jgi:hypothetical protein
MWGDQAISCARADKIARARRPARPAPVRSDRPVGKTTAGTVNSVHRLPSGGCDADRIQLSPKRPGLLYLRVGPPSARIRNQEFLYRRRVATHASVLHGPLPDDDAHNQLARRHADDLLIQQHFRPCQGMHYSVGFKCRIQATMLVAPIFPFSYTPTQIKHTVTG